MNYVSEGNMWLSPFWAGPQTSIAGPPYHSCWAPDLILQGFVPCLQCHHCVTDVTIMFYTRAIDKVMKGKGTANHMMPLGK